MADGECERDGRFSDCNETVFSILVAAKFSQLQMRRLRRRQWQRGLGAPSPLYVQLVTPSQLALMTLTPEGSLRLIVKRLQLICLKKNEQLIWRKTKNRIQWGYKNAHKFEDIWKLIGVWEWKWGQFRLNENEYSLFSAKFGGKPVYIIDSSCLDYLFRCVFIPDGFFYCLISVLYSYIWIFILFI